jgi:hypothetical protein
MPNVASHAFESGTALVVIAGIALIYDCAGAVFPS